MKSSKEEIDSSSAALHCTFSQNKEDEEDIREADLAFKNHSKKHAISLKEMKKRLGLDI